MSSTVLAAGSECRVKPPIAATQDTEKAVTEETTTLVTEPPKDATVWIGRHGRKLRVIADPLKQLALILAAVLLYFGVRGRTQGAQETAVGHGLDILRFERLFGLDFEHWLQNEIVGHQHVVAFANWVYIFGHWPVICATLVWLFHTRRSDYLLLRNAMFISGAIGLVIFMLYPVAPPRLLNIGLEDTVTAFSTSYRALQPPALINKFAAMPSLHVGWNLLIGIAIVRAAQVRPLRLFGILSPILMALAVVATANHYVVDGMAGATIALVGLAVSTWMSPRVVLLNARLREWLVGRRPT